MEHVGDEFVICKPFAPWKSLFIVQQGEILGGLFYSRQMLHISKKQHGNSVEMYTNRVFNSTNKTSWNRLIIVTTHSDGTNIRTDMLLFLLFFSPSWSLQQSTICTYADILPVLTESGAVTCFFFCPHQHCSICCIICTVTGKPQLIWLGCVLSLYLQQYN